MGINVVFTSHLDDVITHLNGQLKGRMIEACNEVRNTTLETLSGTRSGRTYCVPGTKRLYTASAPGEAPAIATGELRQHVKWELEQGGKVGLVGTDLEKGLHLEYGTSKMQARPWLRKSFEKSENKVKDIFQRPM